MKPGWFAAAASLVLPACGRSAPAAPAPQPPPGWAAVSRVLDSAIGAGAAPGALVAVSWRGRHLYYGSGRLGADDPTRPDSSTVYDLASLTKVVGLTTGVMLAVTEGRLDLDAPVARYVPAFAAGAPADQRERVTLRHLLAHSSGLPAWRPLYRETATRSSALALADTTPLDTFPGTRFVYSDLGAIILTQAAEAAYRTRLDSLLAERVFGPLRMRDTRYLPPKKWLKRIAPTENDPWRGRVLRGEVHDENASRLDGVSGHAGLFSSGRDLLRFGDWILPQANPACQRHGSNPPVVPTLPVARFVRPQGLPPGSSRALGWDTPSGQSSGGHYLRPGSFGHTGFTGTSIWLDPSRCLVIVLLGNRVHPTRNNQAWGAVRPLVADAVVTALDGDTLTH